MRKVVVVALMLAGLLAACAEDEASEGTSAGPSAIGEFNFPPAPVAPTGRLEPDAATAANEVAHSLSDEAIAEIAVSDDPRLAWLLSDLLRFVQGGTEQQQLLDAFETLTGVDPSSDPTFNNNPWLSVSNHLIAWDLPAPPGYRERKAELFTALEPGWKPFFDDADSEIDWRQVSWGGVLIDDRPAGDGRPCERGCIPALDDPELTNASQGDWYPDDRLVFGVEVGGETVALPKNIMEIHEMVNMDLGGRRLGIPYCTLCGSAQVYFTDRDRVGGEDLVLRTSGLLSRSNKVMYELQSSSVFDTFTGEALSGPLRERGVELKQASAVTTSWGEWRRGHPDTKIIARDGGLGRRYPLDPLGGRDDNGPIFPVGPVDDRLGAQAQVVGVITLDGSEIAFETAAAADALAAGEEVSLGGVTLSDEAGGLLARDASGEQVASHQAFWFAWSQFHPETELWEG